MRQVQGAAPRRGEHHSHSTANPRVRVGGGPRAVLVLAEDRRKRGPARLDRDEDVLDVGAADTEHLPHAQAHELVGNEVGYREVVTHAVATGSTFRAQGAPSPAGG